jgi:hypothetical protein
VANQPIAEAGLGVCVCVCVCECVWRWYGVWCALVTNDSILASQSPGALAVERGTGPGLGSRPSLSSHLVPAHRLPEGRKGIRAGPSGSQDGDPFSSEWQDKRDREASPAPNRMRLFFRFSYGARQCCLCSNYQVARWIKVKGTGRFTTLDDLIDPKEKSARNAHLVAELRGHDGRVTSDFDNFPFGFSRKTRCKSINQLK